MGSIPLLILEAALEPLVDQDFPNPRPPFLRLSEAASIILSNSAPHNFICRRCTFFQSRIKKTLKKCRPAF
jgi:hypothetical protein